MKIISINISAKKGDKKSPVAHAFLVEASGIEGDAHAASKRPISLLAVESIRKMSEDIPLGSFAENITTEGIDLLSLKVGTKVRLGNEAVIEITQHGKTCHDRCEIYKRHGRCVMPEEGVFAKVVKSGRISQGDKLKII